MNERMPGIGIAQAKVAISAAFKQVWLAPSSTCRLAMQLAQGVVGWPSPQDILAAIETGGLATAMDGEATCAEPPTPEAVVAVRAAVRAPPEGYEGFGELSVVAIYMSLPFGWNASPANYGVFGHVLNSAFFHSGPPVDDWQSMPEYPFMAHTHMDDTMVLEWVIGQRCDHAMRSLM